MERRKADADGCRAAWRAAEARRDEALSAVQQHEGALEGLKDAAAAAAREAARVRDEATRWRAEAEAAATKAAAAKAALAADEQARDIAQRDVQVHSPRPSFFHPCPGLPLNPCSSACVQRAREEVAALRASEEALAAATAEATRALDTARIDLQQQRAAAERERRTAAEARAIRCVRTTRPGPPLSCLSLSPLATRHSYSAVADADLQQHQETAQRAAQEASAAEARLAAAEAAAAAAARELGATQRRLRDAQVSAAAEKGLCCSSHTHPPFFCTCQAESQANADGARRQEATLRGALERARTDLEAVSAAVAEEQRRRAALVAETDALGRARDAADAARAGAEAAVAAARAALSEAQVCVVHAWWAHSPSSLAGVYSSRPTSIHSYPGADRGGGGRARSAQGGGRERAERPARRPPPTGLYSPGEVSPPTVILPCTLSDSPHGVL